MNFSRLILFIYLFSQFFFKISQAGEAPLCEIHSPSRLVDTTIRCELGESLTVDHEASKAKFKFAHHYHLLFKKNLFNKSRTVHVVDATTNEETLTIEVTAPHQAKIVSLIPDKTWFFNGLGSAQLNHLKIKIHGDLVMEDDLELDKKLEGDSSLLNLESNRLYLLKPFSIKNGTFRLKYKEGFLSSLNFPFQSQTLDHFTVLTSLTTLKCPSKSRANLKDILQTKVTVPIADLLRSYKAAFNHDLAEDYPTYSQKTTDEERIAYLKQFVFTRLTDTLGKGILGESIYLSYMERQFSWCQFNDPKVGRNSFDAVHICRKNGLQGDPTIQTIFISEVKYAAEGKPKSGYIEEEGKKWRQLSLPYIENKLEKMAHYYNAETQAIASQIRNHPPNLVELRFAVFNPNNLELVIYHAGNMENSHFD